MEESEVDLAAELELQKQRVTGLESTLMHLQKDYDALNDVVLENANRLEKTSALIQQLTARLEAASNDAAPRKLEDEKPPHY